MHIVHSISKRNYPKEREYGSAQCRRQRPTDQAASTIEDTPSTCDGQQLYPTKVDRLVVPTGKYCKPDATS